MRMMMIGKMMRMMKKMNGKVEQDSKVCSTLQPNTLDKLFKKQIEFQRDITNMQILPADSTQWYSYHMLAMIEELGEVLKADKRWKTHRNTRYIPDEKLEEIADIFITLINICIFSDVDSRQLLRTVNSKIDKNIERLNEPARRQNDE